MHPQDLPQIIFVRFIIMEFHAVDEHQLSLGYGMFFAAVGQIAFAGQRIDDQVGIQTGALGVIMVQGLELTDLLYVIKG